MPGNVKKCKCLCMLLCLILITACSPREHQIHLDFSLQEPPGTATRTAFFIYDITLVDANKQRHPFLLDSSDYPDQVALILLASAQKHFALSGLTPAEKVQALEFTVGVPEDLNHNNPLRAQAPLNNSSMFWSWQQGYKFLRIDGNSADESTDDGSKNNWVFHLGSTGCDSPSALRPPQEPCRNSHRVRVRLPGFDPANHKIEVNLQSLTQQLAGVGDVNCSGSYQLQNVCVRMLRSLGLNPESGDCEQECLTQTLFQLHQAQ